MKKTVGIFIILLFCFSLLTFESILAEQRNNKMNEIGENNSAIKNLRLDIVYDNNPWEKGITTDWGFGCFIRGAGKTILFDTGAKGDILLENMQKMNLDPKNIELIFISHDHWDHMGGLGDILKKCDEPSVYMLKSFSPKTKDILQKNGGNLLEITGSSLLCENVYTTGEMGTDIKEQAMVLKTQRGLVIVTGCAHPGIVAIARKVKEVFHDEIFLIIGGFHLSKDTEKSINTIISELKKIGVHYIAPCHCSGDNARRLFKDAFGERYIEVGAGKTIDLSEI